VDLDVTGRQFVVDVLGRAHRDSAADAHDVFAAQLTRAIDDALHDAGVIAAHRRTPDARCVHGGGRTQPHTVTDRPASAARSSPHMSVRNDVLRERVIRELFTMSLFSSVDDFGARDLALLGSFAFAAT
jgi:hypothetical protein